MTISEFSAPGDIKVVCNPDDERHTFFNSIDGWVTMFLTKEQIEQSSSLTGYIELLKSFVDKWKDKKITSVKADFEMGQCTIVFDRRADK